MKTLLEFQCWAVGMVNAGVLAPPSTLVLPDDDFAALREAVTPLRLESPARPGVHGLVLWAPWGEVRVLPRYRVVLMEPASA